MPESSKTRRRIYMFGEDDIVESYSMSESHYQGWLADGLAPTSATRELVGHRATVVRLHTYQSPSNATREIWAAEESHRIS